MIEKDVISIKEEKNSVFIFFIIDDFRKVFIVISDVFVDISEVFVGINELVVVIYEVLETNSSVFVSSVISYIVEGLNFEGSK